ncbi:MAG: polysaccharide deacetylase family protein [Flavobacteriales bacterium]|nr:polysaccharide deacetylase family protein [Flavobacteriales bacterium]
MKSGTLVTSLDFELAWGVRDVLSVEEYGENIHGVHTALPILLSLFSRHGVHATFATVGMLFLKNKSELLAHLPTAFPHYSHSQLSPYLKYIPSLRDALNDVHHFAPHLIDEIKKTSGMEIGSHTFSHYYCMEDGQNLKEFAADIQAAIGVAKTKAIELRSLVFPRNQFNAEYLDECIKAGLTTYRGNENSWLHPGDYSGNSNSLRRLLRWLDAYINLSGHHCYELMKQPSSKMCNVPASRFLRPYHPRLKWLDGLKLKRITSAMTYAAKNKKLYHLWWHPHNFGIHQEQNFLFLEKILMHYDQLKNEFDFRSLNMGEVSLELREQ